MAAVLCRPSMNQKPLQYFSLSVIKHFWLSFSWQKVSIGKGFYLVYSWTGQFKVELILGWEAHAYYSIVVAQTRNFPVMIDFLNTQELEIFYCFSWLQYYRCQLDFCNSCSVVYAVRKTRTLCRTVRNCPDTKLLCNYSGALLHLFFDQQRREIS